MVCSPKTKSMITGDKMSYELPDISPNLTKVYWTMKDSFHALYLNKYPIRYC